MRHRPPKPRNSIINLLLKLFFLIAAIAVVYRLLIRGNKLEMNVKETYRHQHSKAPLVQNPYTSYERWGEVTCEGVSHRTPKLESLDSCHELSIVDTKEKNGTTISKYGCIRKMTSPSEKCLDVAVRDCAIAILLNDKTALQDILRAWPQNIRRDIYSKGLASAKDNKDAFDKNMKELVEKSKPYRSERFRKVMEKFDIPSLTDLITLDESEIPCELEREPHQLILGQRTL